MKKSEELIGLSIISLNDGKEVGIVKDLIVNPDQGAVECLVVDDGTRYLGVKLLPSKFIIGVGEYAVTIESATAITTLEDLPDVNSLLEQNVEVKGTKVLTKKGRLIGSVSEFYIDEEDEGKIVACELMSPKDNTRKIIPAEGVVTFGKDVLVVVEDIEQLLTEKFETEAREATEIVKGTPEAGRVPEEGAAASEAAKLFEQRQREFLLGRKLTKKLETDNGEMLADEGTVITEELIEKAKAAGKFTELSMNTRS